MLDKKLIVFGIGIVGFLLAFYLVFYFSEVINQGGFKESPVVKKSEQKVRDFSEWVEYTSKLSRFRASFPELPQTDSKAINIPGKENAKGALHVFVSEMPDQSTLMIKVIRFPDNFQVKDVNLQLRETMNVILNANNQNVLRDIKDTTWQGHPAVNFEIQNPDIRLMAKSVYANHSIYTAIYAAIVGEFDQEVFDHFLESFVITTDFNAPPDSPKKTAS